VLSILANRTECSMNGYRHDTICLSVRPSVRLTVTKCIVALKVGVGVKSCTVVFVGRHFLFTASDTFAARCII